MPNITPYLAGRCFDEQALRRMGEAFEKAQQLLRDKGQPPIIRELIANAIIQVAAAGGHDVDELARGGLKALGVGLEDLT